MSAVIGSLEGGVSGGFHVAEAIGCASGAAERARILLRISDEVLLAMFGAISRACHDTSFELGQRYIEVRVASLCELRCEDGHLPAATLEQLELYRKLMTLTGKV